MEQNRIPKGIRTAGQFAATSHPESSLSLTPPDQEVTPTKPWRPYELTENGDSTFTYNEAGAGTALEHKQPVTHTDIRRALRCPRGQGRVVDLNYVASRRDSVRDNIYEVVGPQSGAPLVIRIQDGFHVLQVTSGNVHVEVLDNFGGRTIVEDGVTAGVVVDGTNRYTVETRGSAQARVALSTESKVDVRATGTGAMYVTGGGPGCEILAKDGAVVHQDGNELDHLQVLRPNIWW